MFTLTPEISLTLGIAIAMTLLTVLLQSRRRKHDDAPIVAPETPSPPTANPLDVDSAYIMSLVTRSLELKTKEERLNNAQELYEYLVLHPTLLLQQPGLRDVVQRKATETLRVLQQDNTLPYPFVVRVQRTMDAFVFTLQAITLLPGYVP